MGGFFDFIETLGRDFAEMWRDALQAFALPERRDPAPARRIDTAQARMLHSLALLADAYNRNPDELATRAVSLLRAELEEEDRSPIRRAVRAWREKENRRGTEDTEPKPWSLQAVDFGSEPDRTGEFMRHDRVILDDPEDDGRSLTAEERRRLESWFTEGLIAYPQGPTLYERLQAFRMPDDFGQHYKNAPLEDGGMQAAATDPWPDYEDHMEQLHLNGRRLLARVSEESKL